MSLLLAVLVGLSLSVAIERCLAPRPPGWHRPKSSWCVHFGLWLLAFLSVLVIVQRPWFAMLLVTAFLLLIVVISNAKFKSLAEPFTVQDFRYLTDAIRYPRLYLPFLGWGKAIVAIAAASLAMFIGLWIEPSLLGGAYSHITVFGFLLLSGCCLLAIGKRFLPCPSLNPVEDIHELGLLGALWAYGRALKALPPPMAAFEAPLETLPILQQRPHLVAVQSESFFDPRRLIPGIRPEVLAGYDVLQSKSRSYGTLTVPALGANTVRSEFAFLAGLDEVALGAHKFNPYEALLKGWRVESFPMLLKRLGYRTVCIHPYMSRFYSRDRVFPLLGIDEFIDLSAFNGAALVGHYVRDAAVTEKILEVLAQADSPTFVFAITMENHGPLHLEKVNPEEVSGLYEQTPPADFEDLTVYLRHLKNADQMITRLTQAFDQMDTPVSLCWYGDHVPIMPSVYGHLQCWPKDSDYVVWDNKKMVKESPPEDRKLNASELAGTWLGLIRQPGVA